MSADNDVFGSAVIRTETGVPEISIEWLMDHPGTARIIDVRTTEEFHGELGHIKTADLVPIDTVESVAAGWRRTEPLLMVCRSGKRSGRAATLLENMGFSQVVSLAGGMIRWNEKNLPIEQ